MFGKKKDVFSLGDLEKISAKHDRERKRYSGLNDSQYDKYLTAKDDYRASKNMIKACKKENKKNK